MLRCTASPTRRTKGRQAILALKILAVDGVLAFAALATVFFLT
jgi:hypothetical protein